jgi:uncharacterized membrane protein
MSNNVMNIHTIITLFAIYSFAGWVIEVVYRSANQKKFVNAGLLYGPFIPIYGVGAFMILLLENLFSSYGLIIKLALYGIALTIVEYAAGVLIEKIFHVQLWDYTKNRFNLHGKVCLLYTGMWTGLAVVFVAVIHPAVWAAVTAADGTLVRTASILFPAYLAADAVFSVASLTDFRKKIFFLYSSYADLTNVEIEKIFDSFRRLISAFPYLNSYVSKNINIGIKNRLQATLRTIQKRLLSVLNGRRPFESEFNAIIKDILEHEEFLKLKNYYHHNSSIYEHVQRVSYFSYRIAKFLKMNYRSAARGGLLHDFFLYDWRNHDVPDLPRNEFHGLKHPGIALANSQKYFPLNEIERDSILKHMWPLTVVPPKYKESFIVSFADKFLSSKEFINELKKKQKQKIRALTGLTAPAFRLFQRRAAPGSARRPARSRSAAAPPGRRRSWTRRTASLRSSGRSASDHQMHTEAPQ